MWIHPRSATLVAVLSLICLCFAPSAWATDGGTSIAAASSAKTETAAADPIQTKTVKLTRTQTKSVQRRVKVKPDGALGSGTRRAIKRHQRAKRLTLTGSPNVETLRSLGLKVADKIEARLRAEQAAGVETTAVSAPSTFAAAAIAAATEAIGTPYRYGGNTLAGFDCSGLTVWAFKRAGVSLPRTSFDQYKLGESVPKDEIQPGDLVFFDSAGSGASHVGVATSATTVISATSRGVKDHTFASGYWAGHYVGARRVGTAVKAAVRR